MPKLNTVVLSFGLFVPALSVGAKEIPVPPRGDLQRAIDSARDGDTIVLSAGSVYTGHFTLPDKGDLTGYITLRSSSAGSLAPGIRLRPGAAGPLAVIETPDSSPAIEAADRANHFRFLGLEIRPAAGIYAFDVVRLGNGTKRLADLPHDFVFDRVYIHGDRAAGSKRGIALNCARAEIRNSHLSDFKSRDQDSQAIAGWNGPGPFTIVNNYIEAAGENILFGDPQPTIAGLVPSDITVRGNHFFKPLSWREGNPTYAGTRWLVKNLFELKSTQRVNVEGNVFENCWASGQVGFAIVFTVRTQNGANPTAVIKDVVFRDNLIRNAGHGVNLLGTDENGMGETSNVSIIDNLWENIDGRTWATGPGRLFQILNGVRGLVIEHNTGIPDGPAIMADESPNQGLVFRANIVGGGGVIGSGTAAGTATLGRYFPRAVFEKNVVIGADAAQYPSGNAFPRTLADVGFANPGAGDFSLLPASRYGKLEAGADLARLRPLIAAALSGRVAEPARGAPGQVASR